MEEKLKLTFLGGVGTVTGANFLLEKGKTKILVDCGFTQGPKGSEDKNREPFLFDPSSINYAIITHAHMDHIGRLPKLIHDGFRGSIYSTPSTKDVAKYMLEDAANILVSEARRKKIMPLYTKKDVRATMARWQTVPYHETEDLRGEFDLLFKDAGHVLGSALVCLTSKQKNKKGQQIVFSGDLGNSPTPLLRTTEFISDADYLVMESVYGDRVHEGKLERKNRLADVLNRLIERKGTLMIPVFSLEKTQVLLHEMNDLIEGQKVKSVPVFFDSPLGIRLTEIYRAQFSNFNDKVQKRILEGDDIFDFPNLERTITMRQSAKISRVSPPKIIIASSGMSEGGRIVEHEKKYLSDPKNAILFLGYQALGSNGRAIRDGAKEITIDGIKVPIKAEVCVIEGYSSHKDSNGLVEFVSTSAKSLKKVFVVMGEDPARQFLSSRLKKELKVNAICPQAGESFDLD